MRQGRETLILVLGIAAIVFIPIGGCCSISFTLVGLLPFMLAMTLGIFAWYMGNVDLKRMDNDEISDNDRGHATAGKTLGIIGAVLGFLGIVINVVIFIVIIFFATTQMG